MPVNDHDDRTPSSPEGDKQSIKDALQSKTDEPLPPKAEAIAERDANQAQPVTPQGRHRRYLTRRNAFFTALGFLGLIVAVVLIGVILYRLGFVDRFFVAQVKDTFSKYGIRAEIRDVHSTLPPNVAVEMQGIELVDSLSGEKLGKIDRIVAAIN